MAKILRFSGYFVDGDKPTFDVDDFEDNLKNSIEEVSSNYAWQQLHIEESERFELDGEDKENCDLALLTRHFKKDKNNVQFDRQLPVTGQKYRHFKIGKIVTIIGISRHTETEELSVVYQYEDSIWNRPLEMFMSEVDHEKYPDAKQKYRFELAAECKDCEYMISGDYTKSCTNNIVKSLIWHGEKPFDGNKPCPYYEPKKE